MSELENIMKKNFEKMTWLEKGIYYLDGWNNHTAAPAAEELEQLHRELAKATGQLITLEMKMACGHLARYAVNVDEGTQYCALCSNGTAYDELKNAALTVTKSFECYTAENKPESEYDEYDSWMLPAWKKLLSIVRGEK